MDETDGDTTQLLELSHEKEPKSLNSARDMAFLLHDAGYPNNSPRYSSPPRKKVKTEKDVERKSIWKRVSGTALCKLIIIAYILSCVLVSALYVALYGGQSQTMFAASDAWIPGKVRTYI